MSRREDNAQNENIPLQALPAEVSTVLQEPAANPMTEPGESEVEIGPQSATSNTETVNTGALTASLNSGQFNVDGSTLKKKKLELIIIIVGTCIAFAALFLQFRANRLSSEANELTWQGNAIAQKSYKLQLWDDCHGDQKSQHSTLCQDPDTFEIPKNLTSLVRKDVNIQGLQPSPEDLDSVAIEFIQISYRTCSSLGPLARTEGKAKDVWPVFRSILLNVFVSLVSCHVCYLFVLRNILFRLNESRRRKHRAFIADQDVVSSYHYEVSATDRAAEAMCGLWAYVFAIPQILIASFSGLNTGLDGDRACAFALMILLAMFLVVERQIQRLREDSVASQDEEAQKCRREKPDLRTLPTIGRDTSLTYIQRLTRRLRKNVDEQDH